MRRFDQELRSPRREVAGLTQGQKDRLVRAFMDGVPRKHIKRRFGISEQVLDRVLQAVP